MSHFFTASVLKKSKNVSKLGLFLNSDDHQVVRIDKVSSSFQKKTALVPGLPILHINQTPITSLEQANQLLEETPVNFELELQVQAIILTSITMKKKKKIHSFLSSNSASASNSSIGITVVQDHSRRTIILKVDPNGMFPTLPENSILHAINGQLVTEDFSKTLDLLNTVAKKQSMTLIVLLDATTSADVNEAPLPKPAAAQDKLATTLQPSDEEETSEAWVVVSNESEERRSLPTTYNDGGTSPKAAEAQVEEKVLKLTKHDDDASKHHAPAIENTDVLPPQQLHGDAPEPAPAPAIVHDPAVLLRVVACIIRPSQDMDVGVALKQVESSLYLESVDEHGLFANTGLAADMKLLKINGHIWSQIRQQKLTKANDLLQQATGRITLEATRSGSATASRQIFSIQKASRNFSLGLKLSSVQLLEEESNAKQTVLQIASSSPTCEKVLGLKQGLILNKINGSPVGSDTNYAQELMTQAFPILSLECTSYENCSKHQTQHEESILAQQALPTHVTPENKETAKIVRTTVVDLVAASLKRNYTDSCIWTLAKHSILNAIVVTNVPEISPLYEKINIGQVVVSINHTTCPQTSMATYNLLQKEIRMKPAYGVRVEVGDVQHVLDDHTTLSTAAITTSTKEEEAMIQAMQQAMERANSEILDEEVEIPVLLIDQQEPAGTMELEDVIEAADATATTIVQVAFEDGVQLPKTPKYLAMPPEQKVQWSRNSNAASPSIKRAPVIPSVVDNNDAKADNDSDQAQAKCTIDRNTATISQELISSEKKDSSWKEVDSNPISAAKTTVDPNIAKTAPENELQQDQNSRDAASNRMKETNPAGKTGAANVAANQITPSPHKSNKEKKISLKATMADEKENANPSTTTSRRLRTAPDSNAMQAMFFNVSSRVLFGNDDHSGRSEYNSSDNAPSSPHRQPDDSSNKGGLVMSPSWGRERKVKRDITKIKSQLNLAESALHLASEHALETKVKLQSQVEDLKQQLQTAKAATEAVKEKVSMIESDEEWRLKAIFEAKEEAEHELQNLKSQLEAVGADSDAKKEENTVAAEKLKEMLLEVQDSCAKAKDEVHRLKEEGESKLKEALAAKSKAEHEVASLTGRLRVAEEARDSVETLLEEERQTQEEAMSVLEASLAAVQQEEVKRSFEYQESIRMNCQKEVNASLELRMKDKEEIDSLKRRLVETEGKLRLAQEARKKALQDSSALKEQDARKCRAHRNELEKAEKELSKLREQIATIQASLQVAEDGRRRSLTEVKGLKSDGQAQLKNETEARLRAEKEIVRLEAEVDKSIKGEKMVKKLLEERKKEFEKKATLMESKERKNRAMAEEARQKAESIIADMSDAKKGRLKAEEEVVKTRRTWSFISLLLFLLAFVRVSNDHPIQDIMQSFNDTLSNFAADSEAAMVPDKRLIKKNDDARKNQEAAALAKVEAQRKVAEEMKRNSKRNGAGDTEQAKKIARAEKDLTRKAKNEAILLARQEMGGLGNSGSGYFDEILQMW